MKFDAHPQTQPVGDRRSGHCRGVLIDGSWESTAVARDLAQLHARGALDPFGDHVIAQTADCQAQDVESGTQVGHGGRGEDADFVWG